MEISFLKAGRTGCAPYRYARTAAISSAERSFASAFIVALTTLTTRGLSPLPILAELDTQLIIAEMQGYAPYAREMKSRIK